jgi:hypothetical protein
LSASRKISSVLVRSERTSSSLSTRASAAASFLKWLRKTANSLDEPAVDVALERAAVAVLGETEDLSTSEVSSRHLWGRLKRVDRGSAAVGRRVGAGCRGGR